MRLVNGDLHIHIGSACGQPVKITASRRLQLRSLLYQDAPRKGLDMVGVVDAGSLPVAAEIEEMLAGGELRKHSRGGFLAGNGVLLIPGSEIECQEGFHIIIYFPTLESIKGYQKYMRSRVHNLTLSTQKCRATFQELVHLSILTDGIICPAHAFTPHKGLYGLVERMANVLGRDAEHIRVLELGLSADTDMADMIEETRRQVFLSSSDAHSPQNVGREYTVFRMAEKSFAELSYCLYNQNGRRIMANYGLNPLLGKYHRSYCQKCETITSDPPPVSICSNCGNGGMVAGVYDRIVKIRDYEHTRHPIGRPPYHYRVPLRDLPGIGPGTLEKLVACFGSERAVAEEISIELLQKVAGDRVAGWIKRMRAGNLSIIPGGGGRYGKVKKDPDDH